MLIWLMPVVSDTSPLLNLAIINQLDLLPDQFGEVFIPPAVLAELKIDSDFSGVATLRQAQANGWLKVVELTNTDTARALKRDLDEGESAAIALALQLSLPLILMDEQEGRAAAQAMGLTTIGVLGVLLRAKRMGSLIALRPLLESLRDEAGFYLADSLWQTILQEAGED
jgi:predicted nucleic acid-binding protein